MSKMKRLQLMVRDLINDITGQSSKIEKYKEITHTLHVTSDNEKNEDKKQQIIKACENLNEEKWITEPNGFLSIKGFDPYKNFQNKKLDEKIRLGNNLIQQFNLV